LVTFLAIKAAQRALEAAGVTTVPAEAG
jgi:hypothetical protein